MLKEIWKPIKNYEGLYEVSNFGKVKSLKKEWTSGNHNSKRSHDDIIMVPKIDARGYLYITLSKNGKTKSKKIHRLVLQAFIGESNLECNHKDGIKSNNYFENLEYCTGSQNIKHAFDTGLMSNKGDKNPRSKLDEDIVKNIRENKYKLNRFEFAACYDVSISTIEKIINNKLWAHVS